MYVLKNGVFNALSNTFKPVELAYLLSNISVQGYRSLTIVLHNKPKYSFSM